jgi:non-canonical poly(A) RNA polymerase PAPD5/7
MDGDNSHEVRYKLADDLSDSDEAEMDGDGQPARKRARIESSTEDSSRPQWSNPDPYTALPPPDESQRKKKDVVKLIRKARVETSSGSRAAAEADAGDFISLDFGAESDEEVSAPEPSSKGVAGAPSGPRALLHPRQSLNTPKAASVQAPLSDITNKPPSIQNVVDLTSDDNLGSRKRNAHDEIKAPPNALDTAADPSLGGRKRSARDVIVNPPPLLYKTMRGKTPSVSGQTLKEWRVPEGETGTPWHVRDHSDTASMGVW